MAAGAILRDRVLADFGPETNQAREMLKSAVGGMIGQFWNKGGKGASDAVPTPREVLFDKIQDLQPHGETQRSLQSQTQSMAISLGQMRWLLFEQSGRSISTPFLVVVIFWLSILFAGFGLFAPHNATTMVALLLSAMSVAGAIFLIIELDRPFSGLIQIPSTPLHNALLVIGK